MRMIRRMFQMKVEQEESQVTLSPSLTAHMIRHNLHGRNRLAVIPVRMEKGGLYALDVNPPYEVVGKEIQDTMSEVQRDTRSGDAGFQMEDPTVMGLLYDYGAIRNGETPPPFRLLRVEAVRVKGRWLYKILPPVDDVEEWIRLDRWEWLTRLLQRWHLI